MDRLYGLQNTNYLLEKSFQKLDSEAEAAILANYERVCRTAEITFLASHSKAPILNLLPKFHQDRPALREISAVAGSSLNGPLRSLVTGCLRTVLVTLLHYDKVGVNCSGKRSAIAHVEGTKAATDHIELLDFEVHQID